MKEETREIKTRVMGSWEEKTERQLEIMYDEILDLRDIISYFANEYQKEKQEKEIKNLEHALSDKREIIKNIDFNRERSYQERWDKKDRFRGIK